VARRPVRIPWAACLVRHIASEAPNRSALGAEARALRKHVRFQSCALDVGMISLVTYSVKPVSVLKFVGSDLRWH
jgi:hypothetical protein